MDVDDTVRAGASLWLHANKNIGIGTERPSARLSIVGPGATELVGTPGAEHSLRLPVALERPMAELALASIGFASGNSSSLGIRALRVANGSDWASTSIGLGMDVDNIARAGASLWLHANKNIGIGTPKPEYRLQVIGDSPDYAVHCQNTAGGGAIAGKSGSAAILLSRDGRQVPQRGSTDLPQRQVSPVLA
jgi:hypothetical protein